MIIGTGIDIIEIGRIKRAIERTNGFLERNFSKEERNFFESKGYKVESIAGSFSAKEAFSKAIGTGFRGFSLIDIEILRDDLGKPYVKYNEKVFKVLEAKKYGDLKVHLSISHNRENAIANVILESN
ncbi:MAG: holo-ACP synthase [Sarcina sp.]